MSTLKNLEKRLERWIEGSMIRVFGDQIPAASIASQISEAMKNGLRKNELGVLQVALNPETIHHFEIPELELASQLGEGLADAARDEGILFVQKPQITIYPEDSIAQWDIKVTAWYGTGPLDDTHEMNEQPSEGNPIYPESAFLIINGDQHFILDRPVINIGRREGNQLVLNSPLVSRSHAQIRARNGRFMLFDLGSKSGTFVHGIAIKQHILRPGDVITIADVQMVYGEEIISTADETIGFTPIPPPTELL
jgi:hypothetical protein